MWDGAADDLAFPDPFFDFKVFLDLDCAFYVAEVKLVFHLLFCGWLVFKFNDGNNHQNHVAER